MSLLEEMEEFLLELSSTTLSMFFPCHLSANGNNNTRAIILAVIHDNESGNGVKTVKTFPESVA